MSIQIRAFLRVITPIGVGFVNVDDITAIVPLKPTDESGPEAKSLIQLREDPDPVYSIESPSVLVARVKTLMLEGR